MLGHYLILCDSVLAAARDVVPRTGDTPARCCPLEGLDGADAQATAERNAAVADLREIENRLHDVLAIDVRTIPDER